MTRSQSGFDLTAPLPPRPRSDPENEAARADEGDDADMSAYREFTGKSVEEALRNAREAFGAGLDDLDPAVGTLMSGRLGAGIRHDVGQTEVDAILAEGKWA